MTFSADINGFADTLRMNGDTVLGKVVVAITSDIMKMTPVDTGYARSNYFWGITRDGSTDETRDKSGAPSIARALTFAQAVKCGTTCYITNNLDYILKLEYGMPGGSKQAPNGMARITVARWQEIVNGAVATLHQSDRLSSIDAGNARKGFRS